MRRLRRALDPTSNGELALLVERVGCLTVGTGP